MSAAAGAAAGAAGGGTAGKGPQKGKMPGGKPGNMPGAVRQIQLCYKYVDEFPRKLQHKSSRLPGRSSPTLQSHRWRAAPQGHWQGLLEQGVEPELGPVSGCCWSLGGHPCGTLDMSAASGTRSAGSWEDERKEGK